MNKNLLEGEGYALYKEIIPHIQQYNRDAFGSALTGVRATKQKAPARGRDSAGTGLGIPGKSSERNALHAEQSRSVAEAESKPTRSGVEAAPKLSRSRVEQPSKSSRRVVEQHSNKILMDHVCSHLRRPQPHPGRGLAFGVLLLLLLTVCKVSVAQQVEISGSVASTTDGTALDGVTVTVKNTAIRTITDNNGQYRIMAGSDAVLVFTSVGYQTAEEAVRGRREVNTFLSPEESALDEVVVIGYGETSRRFNTGSVASVSAEEIAQQPVTNVLSALSGRMPGVFVQTTNGLPGGNINIQIRGQGSLTAGTQPLYIIDGVPFDPTSIGSYDMALSPVNGVSSPLNMLNPADIESITVLKDADATAIYGSRGSNGVVLITTKKGTAATDRLNAKFSQGISKAAQLPELMSLAEYVEIREEAFANDGITPDVNNAPELTLWDQTQSTDWGEYLFGGTAPYTDAQASLNGGNQATSYGISANYHGEGNVISDRAKYRRGGIQFRIRHRSADERFDIQLANSLILDGNSSPNIYNALAVLFLSPNYPLFDELGNYTALGANPARDMEATAKSENYNMRNTVRMGYRMFDGLTAVLSGGYNRLYGTQTQVFPQISLPWGTNYTLFSQNTRQSLIVEPQLNFNHRFGAGTLDILLGGTYQNSGSEVQFIKASNFNNEGLMENIASAATIDNRQNRLTEYRYASLFARASYNLKEKYILNATVRRDGSSRFGPGNRFGNFASVGAAWLFAEERWVKAHLPVLSFGKLRASYGTTGNDQIPDYEYQSTYQTIGDVYQGITTLDPARIANADFHWEATRKLDAAVELGFFADKLLANVNYYRNRSSNQLVRYTLPYITGFSSYQANLPAVIENTGWEIELMGSSAGKGKFRWAGSANLTIPKNRLVSFENFEQSAYAQTFEVGYDISRVSGFKLLGVDAQTGATIFAGEDGAPSSVPYSNHTLGKSSPDFYGGLGSTFQYGDFSLDLFFQFAKQKASGSLLNSPGTNLNNFTMMLNRWRQPGDVTDVPRASTLLDFYYAYSSANWFNASYIRFKNVQLSYQLPQRLLSGSGIDMVRIFFGAQNLWTWWNSNSALLDPEAGGYTIVHKNIAPMKSFVGGLELTL